jgi:Na+-driven multidrug efflux pump
MCAVGVGVLGGLLFIFRRSLIGVFMSTDPASGVDTEAVQHLTAEFMSIMIPAFLFLEVMFLVSCMLRGTGAAIAAMEINLISLVFRVGSAFLLESLFGYIGVFIATPVGWFMGMVWALFRYFRKKWATIGTAVPQQSTML